MDNDIFTLRERERDAKLQVLKIVEEIENFLHTSHKTSSLFQLDKNAEK